MREVLVPFMSSCTFVDYCVSERNGCGEKMFELSCVYTYNFKKDFIIKYLTLLIAYLLVTSQ